MALCCQVTVTATSYLTLKRRWKAQKKFCLGLLGKYVCICIIAMSKNTKFYLNWIEFMRGWIIIYFYTGLIWFVPLSSCLLANLIVTRIYPEEHKDHLTVNAKDKETDAYTLTQPIKNNWFMTKECRLFGPFIAVNISLLAIYLAIYYLTYAAYRRSRPPTSALLECEQREM